MIKDKLSTQQLVTLLSEITSRYISGEILADHFIQELTKYMTPDVVFWSNYTPSWEPLRPLFIERRGVDAIVDRYRYEKDNEKIKEGSDPYDFLVSDDLIYYSQSETASFFGKGEVSFKMITKMKLNDGQISRIDMFLETESIEKVYGEGRTF
jgi:hypothetical protein